MLSHIDIHSHLNFPQFDADRAEAIERIREANIWTITVGTDREMSESAIVLAEANDGMFATVGVHPTHEEAMSKEELVALARKSKKVVAIGECGLDYYRKDGTDEAEKKRQKEMFAAHIEAGVELDLPLMIHGRAAYDDIYDVLLGYSKEFGNKVRANMHFFAGSVEDARKFLDLGFTLSFDGPITFASSYDEVIRFTPLERIMAETDAPFAAPVPFRGRRNEPLYVREVAARIAEIRGDELEKVKKTLVENAISAFNLKS
jgi:TatD DNase family protein